MPHGQCELIYLGANVQATSLPVGFRCQFSCKLRIRVKRDVFRDEGTFLAHGVYSEGAIVPTLFK